MPTTPYQPYVSQTSPARVLMDGDGKIYKAGSAAIDPTPELLAIAAPLVLIDPSTGEGYTLTAGQGGGGAVLGYWGYGDAYSRGSVVIHPSYGNIYYANDTIPAFTEFSIGTTGPTWQISAKGTAPLWDGAGQTQYQSGALVRHGAGGAMYVANGFVDAGITFTVGTNDGTWSPIAGGNVKVTRYTTAGAFIFMPDPLTRCAFIEVQGAGGGAGYADYNLSGNSCAAGAGGAGAYAKCFLQRSDFPGASYVVTVGEGGVTGNTPTSGGASSFSSLIMCGGGQAPPLVTTPSTASISYAAGGPGGTVASTAGVVMQSQAGQKGGCSIAPVPGASYPGTGGFGGNSFLGQGGGSESNSWIIGANTAIGATTGYGGGGSGVASAASTRRVGGNGAGGVVVITEYC